MISDYIKNPIIFGAVVGVVLCLLLFIHDKVFVKKSEDKSGFGTYFKIFLAGWIATAPMVWLFFNRNLSFSVGKAQKGGGENIENVVQQIVEDNDLDISETVSAESIGGKLKKMKGVKRCHADMPDW